MKDWDLWLIEFPVAALIVGFVVLVFWNAQPVEKTVEKGHIISCPQDSATWCGVR